MIVRNVNELETGDRVVSQPTWTSRRLLLRRDGMGFSLHDTTIHAGTATEMQYSHHVEAVYCVGGTGHLENLETGEVHPIRDGTLYALDGHERHVLVAETDLRMICVFNPPLVGPEVHDENGAYPAFEEKPRKEGVKGDANT